MRTLEGEAWREIPDSNGAMLSNFGRVRRKNKLLHTAPDKDGYLTVSLGSILKRKYIHRLMGEVWLEPPEDPKAKLIDHVDGCKQNNKLTNLRWVTPAENTKAAYDLGLIKRGKSGFIVITNLEAEITKVFKTIARAAQWAHIDAKQLQQTISGTRKSVKKFSAFKVEEELEDDWYYLRICNRGEKFKKKDYRQMIELFLNNLAEKQKDVRGNNIS